MRGFPIVLKVTANLQVAPVTAVGIEVGRRPTHKPWIHPGSHAIGGVCSEEQRVEEVVGWASHIEVTVLNVTPNVSTHLEGMISLLNGYQVRVGVNIFVESLRITAIGAKIQTTIIETNFRHTRRTHADGLEACGIAGAKLVQHRGAEGMHP